MHTGGRAGGRLGQPRQQALGDRPHRVCHPQRAPADHHCFAARLGSVLPRILVHRRCLWPHHRCCLGRVRLSRYVLETLMVLCENQKALVCSMRCGFDTCILYILCGCMYCAHHTAIQSEVGQSGEVVLALLRVHCCLSGDVLLAGMARHQTTACR